MNHQSGRLPAPFLALGNASFLDFLVDYAPENLAERRSTVMAEQVPHGTTVVAASFADGVVLAGDRRATVGNVIASREIEKVFAADGHTGIGIAGTAGMAVELVRLFQLELEHFEKIEGFVLSLDGKANRLSTMLRSQLPMALQGLAVIPVLAGFDLEQNRGRIFSYDLTGGRFEESDFHCIGSGAVFARGALKKLWSPALSELEAISAVVESLVDAADDDSATGGPDERRGIWPVVAVVTNQGYRRLADAELRKAVESIMARRRGNTAANEGSDR